MGGAVMPQIYGEENLRRCAGCNSFQAASHWCFRYKCKDLDKKREPPAPRAPRPKKAPTPSYEELSRERMALYEQGLSDKEIAARCHPPVHCQTIYTWRRREGLPAHSGNSGRKVQITPEQEKACRAAYLLGLDDKRSARAAGVDDGTYYRWRKREGLPANVPRGWVKGERRKNDV